MIPNTDRAEMRKRCEAATKGPWIAEGYTVRHDGRTPDMFRATCFEHAGPDIVFAARARADLPAALDMIDELVGMLRTMMDTHGAHGPCKNNGCRDCRAAYDRTRDYLTKLEKP
jgi:hypothetical protein